MSAGHDGPTDRYLQSRVSVAPSVVAAGPSVLGSAPMIGPIRAVFLVLVAASLAVRPLPSNHNEPTLAATELLEVVNGEMIETRYQPIVRIAEIM